MRSPEVPAALPFRFLALRTPGGLWSKKVLTALKNTFLFLRASWVALGPRPVAVDVLSVIMIAILSILFKRGDFLAVDVVGFLMCKDTLTKGASDAATPMPSHGCVRGVVGGNENHM